MKRWLCFLGLHRMRWGDVERFLVADLQKQEGRCEACGLVRRRWVE